MVLIEAMYCSGDYHRFIHSPVWSSLKLCTAVLTIIDLWGTISCMVLIETMYCSCVYHRFIHSPVGSSLKLCTAVVTIIDLYILL